MRFVAVTMPVNPPGETLRLTKEQVYEGLVLKAREPTRFVSIISASNILSEHATGLLREVHFKEKPEPVHEKVFMFPPGQVTFTMTSPKSGEQLAHITNVISTTPDGELLVTFTFAFGPNGPLDVGEAAEAEERGREKLAKDTIARTLTVIRELAATNQSK